MLYSELLKLHEAICDHAQLTKKTIDLQIGYVRDNPYADSPIDVFDFEKIADRLPYITRIIHDNGEPLLEWLQEDIKLYQKTYNEKIDNVVNQWLDRVRKIRGVTTITGYPDVMNCDCHFIWFHGTERTRLSVRIPTLSLDPFSYTQMKGGCGVEGVGLIVPRNARNALQKMFPSIEERKVMREYRLRYEIRESKEVIKYEATPVSQNND